MGPRQPPEAPQLAWATRSGPLLSAGRTVLTGVVALITVLVLTFLMLMEGPSIGAFVLDLFPERRAERIRRVGRDAARAVTGYMAGNLLISLIAGVAIYIWLRGVVHPVRLRARALGRVRRHAAVDRRDGRRDPRDLRRAAGLARRRASRP